MSAVMHRTIKVEPLAGALGAEISGVDLRQLSADAVAELNAALMEHLVIFFRDQVMTPEQHKALGRRFGELHIHPITVPMKEHPEIIEVIKEADELGNWGDHWHTDLTALAEPPMGSILYAKEVPPFSGDTQFANMYLAYETLSPAFKRFIDGLVCHHVQNIGGYAGYKSMSNLSSKASEAEHPLVRTHPVTGKKALFLARPGAGFLKGLSQEESEAVFALLYRHSENPDFTCRFRWKKNSVAFWDNRCTRHRVAADYFYAQRGFEPHRRHMHRVTVQGSRPA